MTWNEETRILKANAGKWITNGETYAIEAKLAPSEDVANWREVDHIPEPQPEPEPEEKVEQDEPA